MAVIGVGNQLISSIIRENDERSFRQINPQWFTDISEVELYDFVSNHYRRYGSFPIALSITNEGYELDEALDSPRFYLDQVSDRYIYTLAIERHADLSVAIDSGDMTHVIEVVREMQIDLSSAGVNPNIVTLRDLSESVMRDVSLARMNGGLLGITFGYDPIDDGSVGQLGGNLSFLVGREKMGKTFYLMYQLLKAWEAGSSIMIVSMEMPPQELAARILSMIAGINPLLLRRGEVTHFKYMDMQDQIRGFDNMPPIYFVAGDFRKSTNDIYRYAAQLQPDIVGIDGAYLVSSRDKNHRTQKHETVADVGQELKADCVDLNIPYMATIQFNRSGKGRDGNMDLSAIGGSHALAQVADNIFAIGLVNGYTDRRRYKLLASRSSIDDVDMQLGFSFDPPNFDFIEPFVENESGRNASGGISFQQQAEEQNE